MSVQRPIRHKIFAVSLLPVLALLFVAVINFRLLNALGQSAEQIMSRNYASIKAAQQARQILDENRNVVLAFIFNKDPRILSGLDVEGLKEALAVCRNHIAEIGEQHIVDTLAKNYEVYSSMIERRLVLTESPLPSQEFMGLTARIISDISALVDLNERGMEFAERETRNLAMRAQRHSLFFLFSTIGIIVLLSYWLSHRVAKPIKLLAQSLAGTGQGGNYPCLPVHNNDEIGLLTEQFNSLFKRLQDYDNHNSAILEKERMKVRYAEEAKGRFIADLSHQLKTPMTSLAMSISLITEKRENLTEARVNVLLETAREDCGRMIGLLNELLDIARLDSIVRPAVREMLDVRGLIHKCLKPLAIHAQDKGVQITFEAEAHLPPMSLDAQRFPWVISNLVSNALRHTEKGGHIAITVEHRQGAFYFQCRDDGCGIDAPHLPHIFDRYTQFSDKEKQGTVGLGLAIVKEIVVQHGGDIVAESIPGQGTTFTFWIPEQ